MLETKMTVDEIAYANQQLAGEPAEMILHWDSLLIAACQEVGVTCLYSEDVQHDADYDGVKLLSPFAANPNEPEA